MSAAASGYVREAGDSALLLELQAPDGSSRQRGAIDERVNARAIAAAAAVRRRGPPGLRDVVPTFRSVAVFFDPLTTDVAALAAVLHEAASDGADAGVARRRPSTAARDALSEVEEQASALIDVPVVYGDEFGPDLEEVAAFAGCSPEAVIERHASRAYRVCMLGFLPGFAYMASVDAQIAVPRRASPRLHVAAGSVGIAGRQTAIYPRASPGGWQIIGRTPLRVFDPVRTPPALLAPGDRVRFVPIERWAQEPTLDRGPQGPAVHSAGTGRFITVLRPGLLTTVQDSGRWGYQDRGVSVAGPMDPVAHRVANALVGNPRGAATLEATLLGPELQLDQDTMVAVAGANLGATLNGADLPRYEPVLCPSGGVIRFPGGRRFGARAYVAFDGGIAVPPVLGSRATHVLSGLGGIGGRAARAGDRIPLGARRAAGEVNKSAREVHRYDEVRLDGGGARLRVLPGPQSHYFASDAFERLQRCRFVVSPQSDRIGYRLTGGAPLRHGMHGEMISDAVFVGALQVPPSGEPILLMADRQTTGGYPQLAIVISADMPRAAQLAPGDWAEFELCTRADALSALVALEGKLLAVR